MHTTNLKRVINPKEQVIQLFEKAVEGEQHLKVGSKNSNYWPYFSYYDVENGYGRKFYFDDTPETIKRRIYMDCEVEAFLPKQAFAEFLFDKLDPNALMVMEKIMLLWDDEEGQSLMRDMLEKEYGDSHIQYLATGDLLGQIWTERQIAVINVSSIYEWCKEAHWEEAVGSFCTFFIKWVLSMVFHECRHLFYDCNEIVERGEGTSYPEEGGKEELVERYGNSRAHENLPAFSNIIIQKGIDALESKMEV